MTSLLKAFWGDAATAENDFCYDYLPKRSGNYSFLKVMERLQTGGFEGSGLHGNQPDCRRPRCAFHCRWPRQSQMAGCRRSVGDRDLGLLEAPGCRSARASTPRSSCCRQLHRWKRKAVFPTPDAGHSGATRRSTRSAKPKATLSSLTSGSKNCNSFMPRAVFSPIRSLIWPGITATVMSRISTLWPANATAGSPATSRLTEKRSRKGQQVPSFTLLQADGSTASGNWLYCNSYTEAGNMMQRRGKEDPTGLGMYPEWSWCWPLNRRIVYNRASVDLNGKPWNLKKPVINWNPATRKWEGDVPDGGWPPMSEDGTRYSIYHGR